MTALLTPCSVREKTTLIGILFSLVFWVNPGPLVLAASDQNLGQNQQLVFEVKNLNPQPETPGLSIEEVAGNDPLVNNLEIYLAKHNSPLKVYAKNIIKEDYWQKALAISWVESNFGRFCYNDNCSGIGVKPGHPSWRKYPDKLAWFQDLNDLLAKPIYSQKYTTCRKMKGVYVQPGTENWVRGCERKYSELMKLTLDSETQRGVIAQKQAEKLSLATFPESLNLE